jgi:hypothetical protein
MRQHPFIYGRPVRPIIEYKTPGSGGQAMTSRTIFQTSWESVYRSVEWFVKWGLAHRQKCGVKSTFF